jgi:hypothetical protein
MPRVKERIAKGQAQGSRGQVRNRGGSTHAILFDVERLPIRGRGGLLERSGLVWLERDLELFLLNGVGSITVGGMLSMPSKRLVARGIPRARRYQGIFSCAKTWVVEMAREV